MKFGPREAVFVLLLLALPVAMYFFVIKRGAAEVAEARNEIVLKQARLKELEDRTKNIDDLGAEIDRWRESIALVEQKLPAQRDVETVLRDVSRISLENKLTTKSFHTDKIVDSGHYVQLPIKMTIVGDFAGFYTFLQELEKLPRITRTPTMKLEKDAKQDGAMEAEMILSIFFKGDTRKTSANAG